MPRATQTFVRCVNGQRTSESAAPTPSSAIPAARGGIGGLHHVFRTPAWMWIGGLMGFTVVTAITFAQPRIGATAVIGILIAGQLVMGAVIDRFGLFGVHQIALSPARLAGIALLGIGAALSLVR